MRNIFDANNWKFVNIKRFQSNIYLNFPQKDEEAVIITKYNRPKYVVLTAEEFEKFASTN